jgi:tetratricopeptide (TPR) repeat protein
MKIQTISPEQINTVIKLYTSRKYIQAEQLCLKLLQIDARSVELLNLLGISLGAQEKMLEALQIFDKIIELVPDNTKAYNNRGLILRGISQLDESINSYSTAISFKSNFAEAYNNRGNAYKDIGSIDLAIIDYKKAIQYKPKYINAYVNLGFVLEKSGLFDAAIQNYDKAIQLNPDHAELYNNRGSALKNIGQLEKAIKNYDDAISLKPDYYRYYSYRGDLYYKLDLFEKAIKNYDKAIELKNDCLESYNNRANALIKQGNIDSAIKFLQISIEKFPNAINLSDKLAYIINFYAPKFNVVGSYIKVDKKMRLVRDTYNYSKAIPDEQITELYCKLSSILLEMKINIASNNSQIFRGVNYCNNCGRYKRIFDEYNIIPEYCFGCFKVQINLSTVLELFKLMLVFNNIKFPNDNMRKCMVENRPNIKGTYKGLIYCSTLEDAIYIQKIIQKIVVEQISEEILCTIKRGCSEYAISYPKYSEVNSDNTLMMVYNDQWREYEKYDDQRIYKLENVFSKFPCNHLGYTLNDAFVMNNWLLYAKGKEDISYLIVQGIN